MSCPESPEVAGSVGGGRHGHGGVGSPFAGGPGHLPLIPARERGL